jgi:hypothetical protein
MTCPNREGGEEPKMRLGNINALIKKREASPFLLPFPPDTFVALAEFTINHIWNDNFKSGWHGFPKNRKHISYIDLDPKFYSILSSL